MPATVSQVMGGLATRLGTISGLRTFSYQPEQVNPPIAFPVLEAVEYHRAFGGGDVRMRFSIFVIVGRWTDRTAHAALDEYLSFSGNRSIRQAIEADPTLGGVCSTLVMATATNISALTVADAEYLQLQSEVLVHG